MKIIYIAFLFIMAGFAQAASETSQMVSSPMASNGIANINKGNIEIGGSFSISKNNNESSTNYYLAPSVEYFFVDNISIGGTLSLSGLSGGKSTDYSSYGIGPSASYYFFEQGTTAFYLSQSVTFNKWTNDGETSSLNVGNTSLGIKLFMVPQVAFGIALSTSYAIDSTKDQYINSTALGGSFSFYY